MKKSQITRALIEGDGILLRRLCEQIEESYEVSILKAPEKSLVMTKANDSVSQQPFYMGEVLVTECTISINSVYGFGVLMGEEAERAYQLAVVDGAFQAKLPETEAWYTELLMEEQKVDEKHRREYSRAMKSKVNFDTMEEYNAKR
ncbi:phosphonate C-P lyase system protein PhnG [Paenibacillus prosopidis]|uniref:Alpha-D-ribose 1-methylphosphonate 5-triphosphate synthase subunit PhnG n=1 Tax=Paenibacillus prosopidis TaxID=630520 RepID=A0A368W8R5_9BACL|nr:phosphonate C-P lyase system protein PhnG [Paenibacillus prosopidis]RCW51723.1 alpha-D-ribose 1-methylphosphonate 5-triphosphate synthase subunit PhnG [Paenibacillus prosopidis]